MQESRVGKMLSDNTIKKVIIFVLIILIVLPMFDLFKIDPVNAQIFSLNEFLIFLAGSSINKNLEFVYQNS